MTKPNPRPAPAMAAPFPALPWGEGILLLTVLFLAFSGH